VIGERCSLGQNVVVMPGTRIGNNVKIQNNVSVYEGVELEDDVFCGPSMVFTNVINPRSEVSRRDEYRRTLVRRGATIGANATVVCGSTLGEYAFVGAGAVVTRSVPAHAVVVGNPARIVRYVEAVDAPPAAPVAPPATGEAPLGVRGVTLERRPVIRDMRGNLTAREVGQGLPFAPRRYFIVHDVPTKEVRGEHAHRTLHQVLVCIRGSVTVLVDDGVHRQETVLDSPELALHVPPMVWCVQYKYTPDAALLVLASDVYDPDDYVRDYEQFLRELRGPGAAGPG
jgi:acetyltransferase-like isoleucine patch superfamily enzyme/dTDP-4-dehydrorhamnose 3,5-epimerase-like enzyme